MGELVDAGPEIPYVERACRMIEAGFAVWDVLECAVRPGSLDAAIDRETARPNDFGLFLRQHPNILRICFNGQKAAAMFERMVLVGLEERSAVLDLVTLPSTSPAHAAMTFGEKLSKWSIIKVKPCAVGQ